MGRKRHLGLYDDSAGPLVSALSNKYDCQKVSIAGAVLASACLFVSSYAVNITTLYITIGLGTGNPSSSYHVTNFPEILHRLTLPAVFLNPSVTLKCPMLVPHMLSVQLAGSL